MTGPPGWEDDPRFREPALAYEPDMSTAQPTPRLRWLRRVPSLKGDGSFGTNLQQEFVAYGRDEYGSAVPRTEWRDVPCEEDEP